MAVPGIRQSLDDIKATLDEIERGGDDGAPVAFARIFVRHGNCTDEARKYARRYVDEHKTQGG